MGFRELQGEAIKMRTSGKTLEEIRAYLFKAATALGGVITDVDLPPGGFEIRHTVSGQRIRYTEAGGFSYYPS